MKPYDKRHRWSPPVRDGAWITSTCSACGKSWTVEVLVPDATIAEMAFALQLPNPLRLLAK